jgi:hypothetical protein
LITAAINNSYAVNNTGNYYVMVSNALSCGVKSNTLTPNYYAKVKPVITPSGNTNTCLDANLTLSSSLANNYKWYKNDVYTGITTQTFQPTTLGANGYTVIVTNANGCIDTSLVTTVTLQQCTTTSTIGNVSEQHLSIAPNPFEQYTVISNHANISEIWIYNNKGDLIDQVAIDDTHALGQNLSPGLYLIRYQLSGEWHQIKMIKK